MVPSFEIANDDHSIYVTDEALNAALRYFAEHGLAAANEARCNAEHAAVDGDRAATPAHDHGPVWHPGYP